MSNGGNSEICDRVYLIMKSTGFGNIELYPIYRTGKSKSQLWQWLARTNENHGNVVAANLITEKELQWYYRDWVEREKDDLSFITAPPLMITIREK